MFLALELYPTLGGSVMLVVGVVASVGYARTQSQKVWRESSEGWKAENEANKEKSNRLSEELARTAQLLHTANAKTDITTVLSVLSLQHKEATAVLTRIADESAARNGHIAKVLAEANLRVADQHKATILAIDKLTTEAAIRNGEIMEIAAETYKTVEMLRALPGGS